MPRETLARDVKSRNGLCMASRRIAGIDYGTARIGIAIADEGGTIATAYENYARRGERADAERFRQLVKQEGITRFIVGLPIHLDGRESAASTAARQFGRWLAEVTSIAVEFFDERFSTSEAGEHLSQAGLSRKKRKQRLDKLAAQVMLTAYLEAGGTATSAPGGLDD